MIPAFLNWLWARLMPDTPSTTIDLGFIREDIRNQISHSRSILAQIELLQKALTTTQDGQVRFLLDKRVGDAVTVAFTTGAVRWA